MSESRKQFNYSSVVLADLTREKEGIDPATLGATSNKFIWATCRVCGQPHRLRKGQFVRSGSACHKQCKSAEMSAAGSPFKDPAVRAKAAITNVRKYGVAEASRSREVADRISATRRTDESRAKSLGTNLERYGVENPFQSEEVKAKIAATNRERYGTDNVMQSPEVRSKAAATNRARYGVDNPLQNPEVYAKAAASVLRNYGVANPMQNEAIRERARRTNRERYGEDNPMQSPEVRSKVVETCLRKYGVEHPMQFEEFKRRGTASFRAAVAEDENLKFRVVALLRDDAFWGEWEREAWTLDEVARRNGLQAGSLRTQLVSAEFRERYERVYTYPRNQSQKEVANFLRSLGLVGVVTNTRRVIAPLEIDVWCPSKQFAVEFNGSFWHSEAWMEPPESRWKHRDKLDICRKAGVRLFTLFEKHWDERRPQVEAFLRSAVGCNSRRLDARKCEVTFDRGHALIESNHIQGLPQHVYRTFDLVHDGEVVMSVSAARHHRRNTEEDVVLNRLVSAPDTTVRGGLTRLLTAFRAWAAGRGYRRIVTWSDNCWTDGGGYARAGFTLAAESAPDYFYWDAREDRYLSKQSQRKTEKCPPGTSELAWTMSRGLYRIWDCGKRRWEMTV